MEYDVYYSTGGGAMVGGGADVWVNHWIENIAPKLKVKPKLLIHRIKPKQTQEQIKTFKNSVKTGGKGNTGRQVHKKIEKSYKEVLKDDLEHYWQGDDIQKFQDLLKNARRIHILHGYYSPHKYLIENQDRIYSNAVHVSVDLAMKASMVLNLEHAFHFHMERKWENELCEISKNPFWVGLNPGKLKHSTQHIPNFYEFKHNKDVTESNKIGFAARMETRKCPHFLEGLSCELTTDPKDVQWWRKNLNTDTTNWKIYKFNYDYLEKFYNRDWGVSHSAHIYEPFGYSIFQALDFGKIPILSKDWLTEYEYPFRAFTKEEFHQQYKNICDLTLNEKRDYVFPLREYLDKKYGDKQRWVDSLLRIYNS